MAVRYQNGGYPAYAFESITVSSTAVGFTPTTYTVAEGATGQRRTPAWALVTVESQSIRYRTDGGNPTASVGHLLTAGDALVLDHPRDVQMFRAIRVSSDATIQVTYAG